MVAWYTWSATVPHETLHMIFARHQNQNRFAVGLRRLFSFVQAVRGRFCQILQLYNRFVVGFAWLFLSPVGSVRFLLFTSDSRSIPSVFFWSTIGSVSLYWSCEKSWNIGQLDSDTQTTLHHVAGWNSRIGGHKVIIASDFVNISCLFLPIATVQATDTEPYREKRVQITAQFALNEIKNNPIYQIHLHSDEERCCKRKVHLQRCQKQFVSGRTKKMLICYFSHLAAKGTPLIWFLPTAEGKSVAHFSDGKTPMWPHRTGGSAILRNWRRGRLVIHTMSHPDTRIFDILTLDF